MPGEQSGMGPAKALQAAQPVFKFLSPQAQTAPSGSFSVPLLSHLVTVMATDSSSQSQPMETLEQELLVL